jgi:hypothetical protein
MNLLMVDCPACDGWGGEYDYIEHWRYQLGTCGWCHGNGTISRYRAWEWRIIITNKLPPSMWPEYLAFRFKAWLIGVSE